MARFLKSRVKAKGAAPGSLIFMGNQKMESTRIRLFKYSENDTSEDEFDSIDKALEAFDENDMTGLILDLRNNGGGALTDAVGIDGMFGGAGPVVQVRNGKGDTKVADKKGRYGSSIRSQGELEKEIQRLEKLMFEHAKNLAFEDAANLRDEIEDLRLQFVSR